MGTNTQVLPVRHSTLRHMHMLRNAIRNRGGRVDTFYAKSSREVKELVKTFNSIQPWKHSRSYLCCWRYYTILRRIFHWSWSSFPYVCTDGQIKAAVLQLLRCYLCRMTETPPKAAHTTACINTRYVTDLNAAFKKVAYIKVYYVDTDMCPHYAFSGFR